MENPEINTEVPQIESEERSYIAFISYRHLPLDKQAAELIQKKIENYRIPKEFQEKFGGSRFGHCFRDEDELPATGSLTDSIYYALDHTQYLIVICTPDLPKSKWCEAEIKYFLRTHDRDHILAALVDGDPSESFSPYLLYEFDEDGNIIADTEPLAANIAGPDHTLDKKALNKEIVRFYAAFLGCAFDDLWQRERRARTNRLLSLAGIAVAVMAVFLGVVLNRNARIEEQSMQIQEQNEELVQKNEEIQEQNDKITDQNIKIEGQNLELQTRLSASLVDSGFSKLAGHDFRGAQEDAIAALESDDPSIYDHRVGQLLSKSLFAYMDQDLKCSIVHSQSTQINQIRVSADYSRVFTLDQAGILRCHNTDGNALIWEVPTGYNTTSIFTNNLTDRVICHCANGAFCYSNTDGSLLWSHPRTDNYGNRFCSISNDGSIFAVIDKNALEDEVFLVFINTKDGSELGRVDMSAIYKDPNAESEETLYIGDYYSPNEYASSFSVDDSLFVFCLPVRIPQENTFDKTVARFWYVDLKTFEAVKIGTLNEYNYFYGVDIDPDDKSVFLAEYSNNSFGILTVLASIENGSYVFKEKDLDHRLSTVGGFDLIGDTFNKTDCHFLVKKGRVYIFSDNGVFIYDRKKNTTMNYYALSAQIINAFWVDDENNVLEIATSDGYVIDYHMDYNEGKVISDIAGRRPSDTAMDRICRANDSMINENGAYYTISNDLPGKLLNMEYISDPHGEILVSPDDITFTEDILRSITKGDSDLTEDGTSASGISFNEFLIDEGIDNGILLLEPRSVVVWFDKKTGVVLNTASFEDTFYLKDAVLLDNDHFLYKGKSYCSDGTVIPYFEPLPDANEIDNLLIYYDGNIRLSNGQILSWSARNLYGYKDANSAELFSSKNPCVYEVWLDGKYIHNNDTVYLSDYESNDSFPKSFAGENGLLLFYGQNAVINDNEFTANEERSFDFFDVLTGKTTKNPNPCPEAKSFKPAFAHGKKECTIVFDNEKIFIYEPDASSFYPLEQPYLANEIIDLCYSDDDRYLMIVTVSGRLDIYDTDTWERRYSEIVDSFQNKSQEMDLKYYVLTSDQIPEKNLLMVSLLYGSSYNTLVLDTSAWTPFGGFSSRNFFCDSDTCRLYSSGEDKSIIVYPVYDIPALKEWAEEELKK